MTEAQGQAWRPWRKAPGWETAEEDGRRVCGACRSAVRSYTYRMYPPDSPFFERCVGLAWCAECRVYGGSVVHVPRSRVLDDALAGLPDARRERIARSEGRLVQFLDRRGT
ncbi:hypothetical protein [Streptomyces griseosporeus]|uniref:hypothetical protein n=1 Tax=Streptomyces griseosporeus TaxID=1910 RepID=UPI003700361E